MGIVAAVAAIVVTGAVLGIDRVARGVLERALAQVLQARVTVDGISGLATGRLHLHGVRARRHGAWRIAIGDATITWSGRALLDRRLDIARIDIRQPRIALTERAPDALPTFGSDADLSPVAVTIGRVVIDDGRVVVASGPSGERALYGVEHLTADVRPRVRDARWAAVVRQLALRPLGHRLPEVAASGVVKTRAHGVGVGLQVALAGVGPARIDADVPLDAGPLRYRVGVVTPGLLVRPLVPKAPIDRVRGSLVLHGEHETGVDRLGYAATVQTTAPAVGAVSLSLDGHAHGGTHRLEATVGIAGTRATARGTLALDGSTVDAEVKATSDLALLGRQLGMSVGGMATVAGVVRGPLAAPTVTVSMDVAAPSYGTNRLQRVVVAAAVEPAADAVRANVTRLVATPLRGAAWGLVAPTTLTIGRTITLVPATLTSVDGRVSVGGRLGPSAGIEVTLGIERLDLAGICRTLGTGECTGLLTARARVSGTGPAPRIDAVVQHSIGAQLVATGTVPFPWPSGSAALDRVPFDLAVRSDGFDLASLQPFVKDALVQLAGRADVVLGVTGPLATATVTGRLRVTGGRLEPVGTRVRYEDVTLSGVLVPGALVVETMSATAGGTLRGSGRIGLRGLVPETIDLGFDLDRLRVVTNPGYEAAASGRLGVGGSPRAPVIRGDVVVGPAVLRPAMLANAPTAPDPTIEIVGSGAPPTPAQTPGIVDALAVDLVVRVGDDVAVRRADARIDLGGRLAVTKAPYEPWQVRGDVRLVRGWTTFEGRRFTVEPSAIHFDGPPASPALDLAATTRSAGYDVRVEVTGTPDKPVLALTSEPPLGESDVLAVLLFGTPTSELGAGQQADLQSRAVGLASNYVASGLAQSVKGSLGLDVFDVSLGDTTHAGEVRVGRYVTPDVFLSLAQEFGARVGQAATIEYRLRPRLSVRGSTSTTGSSAVDVFWHRRY